MKATVLILLGTAAAMWAGTPENIATAPPAEPSIMPLIDIRGRYEFADIDGKDVSHALTIAKLAHFESEGDAYAGAAPLPVTTRVSIELNYTF